MVQFPVYVFFSHKPLDECKQLILDYQSKSSVAMVNYLQKNYWNYSFKTTQGEVGYESNIADDVAGLVIGDRCFDLKNKYKYVLDLGAEWKMHTGMPFVFAVWVTKEFLSSSFREAFNNALASGVQNLDWSAKPHSEKYNYLFHNISYQFDTSKRASFDLFMEYLTEKQMITSYLNHYPDHAN